MIRMPFLSFVNPIEAVAVLIDTAIDVIPTVYNIAESYINHDPNAQQPTMQVQKG